MKQSIGNKLQVKELKNIAIFVNEFPDSRRQVESSRFPARSLLNIGCEDQLPPKCHEEHFQVTTKQLPTYVSVYTHFSPHVLRLHTTPCILCNSSSIFDVNTIHFSMSTIWAGKISGILGVLGPGGGLKSSIDSVSGSSLSPSASNIVSKTSSSG